jgi:hypothetical protein
MIYLGKQLQKDDLHIFFYREGVLFDPYSVQYTIFDCTTGKEEIIRQTTNSKPMRFDVGSYFVPIHIHPKIFRIGRHIIRWTYKDFIESEIKTSNDQFDVTRPVAYAGEFCRSTYAKEI